MVMGLDYELCKLFSNIVYKLKWLKIRKTDLMNNCSGCGILKKKTDFYFRNIDQNLGKTLHNVQILNKEYIILQINKKLKCMLNKTKKNFLKKKKLDTKTDKNFRLIHKPRSRIYKSLKKNIKIFTIERNFGNG